MITCSIQPGWCSRVASEGNHFKCAFDFSDPLWSHRVEGKSVECYDNGHDKHTVMVSADMVSAHFHSVGPGVAAGDIPRGNNVHGHLQPNRSRRPSSLTGKAKLSTSCCSSTELPLYLNEKTNKIQNKKTKERIPAYISSLIVQGQADSTSWTADGNVAWQAVRRWVCAS